MGGDFNVSLGVEEDDMYARAHSGLGLNFFSVDLMIAKLHFMKKEEHFGHMCKVNYKEAG